MTEASRSLLRERIKSHLIIEKSPRRDMAVIMILAGAAAFLASVSLLSLGLKGLVLRYPLAALIGYAVFLMALRLWVLWREPRARNERGVDLAIDVPLNIAPRPHGSMEAFKEFGGGGGFSGGGASGTIEPSEARAIVSSSAPQEPSADVDIDWDAEGLIAIPLVLLAVLLSGAALYFVVTAPILFAELIVDALIAAGVYRRLRRLPARHWLMSSLSHTWRPFMLLFVVTLIVSMILQAAAPSADSIGDVFRQSS